MSAHEQDYITGREFERWMNVLHEQNKDIIREQRLMLVEARKTNGRVTVLEGNQEKAGKISAKLSAIVGIIVAGIINGVLAAITHK